MLNYVQQVNNFLLKVQFLCSPNTFCYQCYMQVVKKYINSEKHYIEVKVFPFNGKHIFCGVSNKYFYNITKLAWMCENIVANDFCFYTAPYLGSTPPLYLLAVNLVTVAYLLGRSCVQRMCYQELCIKYQTSIYSNVTGHE